MVLAACQVTPAGPKPVGSVKPATTPGKAGEVGRASGRVLLPASLISDAGGTVVSNNGGGLVTDNGAGLRLLGLPTATAAGVKVTIADGAGQPLPDASSATTDADGRFAVTLPRRDGPVVLTATFQAADGRTGTLRARATMARGAAMVDVTLASTFVWVAVAPNAADKAYDLAAQERAINATDARLTPVDAAGAFDEAAIKRRMEQLAGALAELRADLAALDARFAAIAQRLDDLEAKLRTPEPTPTPAPLPPRPAVRVSTVAGAGPEGFADGAAAATTFGALVALAVAPDGTLVMTDHVHSAVRTLDAAGQVATRAGGTEGSADGVGRAAAFYTPLGLAVDAQGVA